MQETKLPYDITDIPVFAWSPSARVWIVVLAFIGLSAGLILLFFRSRQAASLMAPFDTALSEIRGLFSASHLTPAQKVASAHLTVKKAVGLLCGIESAHLTASEIETLLTGNSRLLLPDQTRARVIDFVKASANFMYGGVGNSSDKLLKNALEALSGIKDSYDSMHGGGKK